MTLSARAGLLFFAFCFTAGAILGPIRVTALEPSIGATAAVAIEAPIMLAVMVLAARAVLSRQRCADPVAVGLIGLALKRAYPSMPTVVAAMTRGICKGQAGEPASSPGLDQR